MSVMAIAVVLAAVMVVLLVALTLSLRRQVRRLGSEVRDLSHVRHGEDLAVIRPTPLGPPDVEPDLAATRVASVTLTGPLVKVAAFSHGVRRALAEDSRMRIAYAFRKELRHQRRVRRKRAAAAGHPPKEGWRP
ncbi:MAG: hypothetical protein WKF54_13880 [Nocardioidaceae bacterium]